MRPVLVVLLAAATLTAAARAGAEIYKYRDAEGRVHFTDRPPAAREGVEVVGPRAATALPQADLAAALEDTFKPRTPIERASLAVVAVRTPAGGGSGFFVSPDGYLITNRHVVRPTTSRQWQARRAGLEEAERRQRKASQALAASRKRIEEMRRQLERYRRFIEGQPRGALRASAEADYRILEGRYRDYRQRYRAERRRLAAAKAEIDRRGRDLRLRGSAAAAAVSFRVMLKDNTELSARLVRVSERQDLALLKVDGHTTPYLRAVSAARLVQGGRVYAIGAPLGMRDSVTAGVVARAGPEAVMSDARVLPGNSGGPLLDEQGRVVGINTLKVAESALAAGFGIAIPIDLAEREFADLPWPARP